jgi:hypothetical protein
MRSIVRNIVMFILGGLVAASLMFVAFHMPREAQRSQVTNLLENPSQGISLIAPVAQAIEATSTTPPLNTSRISFIAYYQRTLGWTLADTVPAFVSYFDGGNYYDGLVRVWDSGTIGSSSGAGDTYLDVKVRVRADGWILAWFDRFSDDSGAIVWWGHQRAQTGSPPSYSTTLSRAMEIVFTVTGIGFPGHNMIGMYDYSEPSAKRLLIFGYSMGSGSVTYYYTIPANSTMVSIKLLVRAGGGSSYGYANTLRVDDGLIYQKTDNLWGWSTFQVDAWAKGIQHTVIQSGGSYTASSVAFIMWTG